MDKRTPGRLVTTSPDAELPTAAIPRSDHLADQPVTPEVNSTVVYCGNAERVREGFLLALSLLQASNNLLTPDAARPVGHLTQEDN